MTDTIFKSYLFKGFTYLGNCFHLRSFIVAFVDFCHWREVVAVYVDNDYGRMVFLY
jgi:hypothetical protein